MYVLVRDLEFSIDPAIEIEKKVKYVLSCQSRSRLVADPSPCSVVTRPCVKSEPLRGNQMPLYIRRVLRSQGSESRTDRHFGAS